MIVWARNTGKAQRIPMASTGMAGDGGYISKMVPSLTCLELWGSWFYVSLFLLSLSAVHGVSSSRALFVWLGILKARLLRGSWASYKTAESSSKSFKFPGQSMEGFLKASLGSVPHSIH